MSTAARIAGFALTLLAVLGAGFGVGRAVGPLDVGGSPTGRVEPTDRPEVSPGGTGGPMTGHGAPEREVSDG